MKNLLFLIVFGIFFASCMSEKTLDSYMVNSWQTTYLKIDMPTYLKSDSIYVYEDTFEVDPQLIAQSTYFDDGTFKAWYLNPQGEKLNESLGKWRIEGDSLFVAYDYQGKNSKVSYYIEKTEEGFKGVSLHDWDSDGEFDDLLVMKTKRIVLDK